MWLAFAILVTVSLVIAVHCMYYSMPKLQLKLPFLELAILVTASLSLYEIEQEIREYEGETPNFHIHSGICIINIR